LATKLAEIKRAQELDPLSLPIKLALGWFLSDAGQLDQSIEQFRRTLEMDPNIWYPHQGRNIDDEGVKR
jgi:tetratricopeptide (TPR) repeat protein